MDKKIKECPSCGKSETIIESILRSFVNPSNKFFVHCSACGFSGGWRGTREGAIDSWNRRTMPQEIIKLFNALKEILPRYCEMFQYSGLGRDPMKDSVVVPDAYAALDAYKKMNEINVVQGKGENENE